jgi:hypothetical protein
VGVGVGDRGGGQALVFYGGGSGCAARSGSGGSGMQIPGAASRRGWFGGGFQFRLAEEEKVLELPARTWAWDREDWATLTWA